MPKPSSRPADPAVEDRERGAFAGDVAQRTKRDLMGSTAQPRGPPARHEATPKAAHRLTIDEIAAISASLAAALAEAITAECRRLLAREVLPSPRHLPANVLQNRAAGPRAEDVQHRDQSAGCPSEAAARWRAEREAASAAEANA